jgi:hypothetical protein
MAQIVGHAGSLHHFDIQVVGAVMTLIQSGPGQPPGDASAELGNFKTVGQAIVKKSALSNA